MVRSILQDLKLVREVRSDPLHGMTEQMQQEKALHLEIDVGVDDDPQTIEDPGPRGIQVTIFDHESVLDDSRGTAGPQ